jgi:hypothetical protein
MNLRTYAQHLNGIRIGPENEDAARKGEFARNGGEGHQAIRRRALLGSA